MNDVLCDIFNWHVFIYLDDILIFSRYREQHIHHAWSVFQHLLKNSLSIKAEQCGWGLSDPCAFFSCCLSTAERNSDIGKRELFTVSYSGTIGWRLPIRLFVWTDHKNKIYLLRPWSPICPQSFPICRGPHLVCLLGSTPAQWTAWVYELRKGGMLAVHCLSEPLLTVLSYCLWNMLTTLWYSLPPASLHFIVHMAVDHYYFQPKRRSFLVQAFIRCCRRTWHHAQLSVGLWDAMLSPSSQLISRDCLSLLQLLIIKILWGTLLTRKEFKSA